MQPRMEQHGPLAYQTYGALNQAADNCVLMPTYYAGTDRSYLPQIGTGRALDPARWFIVIPNMLGNGVSASPSNTTGFTPATVAGNVAAQHALLASLKVRRIALIYGWSMGAMQAYAWAAAYPEMVAAVLAVCGSAKCWPLNHVFIEGLRAAMRGGKRAFGTAYAGWAYSAAFYRGEMYQPMGFATRDDFLTFWADDHDSCSPCSPLGNPPISAPPNSLASPPARSSCPAIPTCISRWTKPASRPQLSPAPSCAP
jgi:homoserine O-acetyltransferase